MVITIIIPDCTLDARESNKFEINDAPELLLSVFLTCIEDIIYVYFFIHKPETEMNEAPQHDSTHGFLHSRAPLKYVQCNNNTYVNRIKVLPAVNKSLWCTTRTAYGIAFFFIILYCQKDTSGPLIRLLSSV